MDSVTVPSNLLMVYSPCSESVKIPGMSSPLFVLNDFIFFLEGSRSKLTMHNITIHFSLIRMNFLTVFNNFYLIG